MCKPKPHTQTTFTIPTTTHKKPTHQTPPPPPPPPQFHPHGGGHSTGILTLIRPIIYPIIAKFHAGYFRITLSLCWQTLLLKTLGEPPENAHAYRKLVGVVPFAAFVLMWSLSFFVLVSLSVLYILRCVLLTHMVRREYLNNISVNYLFAPWISWILLLQTAPFLASQTVCYLFLWVFILPVIILDVKIYGQWFIKGKRFLSTAANPASQLSVIGNFVGARAAAQMGWTESAVIMFSLGIIHYLVLFVTLYQRLLGNRCMPTILRPVMFLFVAAPSMGSLAWDSISGTFDCSSKMLFYLSMFLFLSLVSRPNIFKKSMEKFNVVWWSYSYPLTILALASTEYAQEMKTSVAHLLMIILSALSLLVSLILMVYTLLNTNIALPRDDDVDDVLVFAMLRPKSINSKHAEMLT